MKKHVEKIRKWLGGAAEEYVVRRVAFWWLVYYQGAKGSDLLTVKAGGEDIVLQLNSGGSFAFGGGCVRQNKKTCVNAPHARTRV